MLIQNIAAMSFELTHPIALTGLVLIILLVGAYRYSLVDFSRRQQILSLFIRCSILIFIVLALAGLTLILPTHQTMIVLLTDQSRSINAAAAEKRDQFLDQCRYTIPQHRFGGIIPFGTADSTDIAGAINPGLALIPPEYVPHLVLLSDGNETQGNVLTAALQSGAIVSTIPLPSSSEPEVQAAELKFPSIVRQGEPFYLDVVIQSNTETDATITIFKGPYKLLEEKKTLKIGKNIFRFQQAAEDERQQELIVTVSAESDTILDNNRLSGIIVAEGTPQILIIDSESSTVRELTSALREQEIAAEVRPPEGLPKTLEELTRFDAVVLSDVPATAMSNNQMNLLKTYVSELGGGLMMFGSDQTFGLGGYYQTPIEEILPVYCDYKKEQEKPSLAMCIVLDRSGSMGGQKMELAKDAAKAAVELLTPQDFASVIAFDNESYPVIPMQSTASTTVMLSAISTIEAAGGTNIYPALAEAYEQLRRIPARLKHVILLTDGYSSPGDFETITRQFARDSMTVSTVGVGDADHELLKTIAEIGRGRHYVCDDPLTVPQIFAKETIAASQSAIRELPFLPVQISATTVLRQIDMDAAPPLLGYVATKPKPTAQFILATETSDPLLMWHRFGLGQTAAFSSDAKSRWGAEWITWEYFGQFWAQVIRHIMRQVQQNGSALQIETLPEGLHITLDSMDENDRYVSGASGSARLIRSDLTQKEQRLFQTAPGRYEAVIPFDETAGQSAFQVQTELKLGEKVLENQSRSVMVPSSEELRIRPSNEPLLRQLAELSGGKYDVIAAELSNVQTDRSAQRTVPLWYWLLTFAAVLFVFDVLFRRIEII